MRKRFVTTSEVITILVCNLFSSLVPEEDIHDLHLQHHYPYTSSSSVTISTSHHHHHLLSLHHITTIIHYLYITSPNTHCIHVTSPSLLYLHHHSPSPPLPLFLNHHFPPYRVNKSVSSVVPISAVFHKDNTRFYGFILNS